MSVRVGEAAKGARWRFGAGPTQPKWALCPTGSCQTGGFTSHSTAPRNSVPLGQDWGAWSVPSIAQGSEANNKFCVPQIGLKFPAPSINIIFRRGRIFLMWGRGGGRKRHIPPHPAQPRHTNYWAPRTRQRHQQEHRPQRPTERSDPTQHAKGRTGDGPGPRKETATQRNVTQGGGVGRGWPGPQTTPPPPEGGH